MSAASQGGDRSIEGATEPEWRRLDRRTVAVASVRVLLTLIPVAVAWVILDRRGAGAGGTLVVLSILLFAAPAAQMVRYLRVRYRIAGGELQLLSGLAVRSSRSIPLHRIRAVDVSAGALLRAFDLAVVRVGTGEGGTRGGGSLTLDAVRSAQAHSLRVELLTGSSGMGFSPTAEDSPVPGSRDPGEERPLLTLRARWVLYQLLGVWLLVTPLALAGSAYQLAAFISPGAGGGLGDLARDAHDALPSAWWLPVLASAYLLVGAFGAAAIFGERWWGYRLRRDHRGRLSVTRGLITTRSLTLDPARVRGATLSAALPARAAGGMRVRPIITGSTGGQGDRESGQVAPLTDAAQARRVADIFLGGPAFALGGASVDADLARHPHAARRRLLVRHLAPVAASLAALVPGLLAWGWPPVLLAIPAIAAPPLALAALWHYRALGHRLDRDKLCSRRGFFVMRTDLVQRRGISGVAVRQSPMQRRLGLADLQVTTAAGEQAYRVVDIALAEARSLAVRLGADAMAPSADEAPAFTEPDRDRRARFTTEPPGAPSA